MADAGSHGGPLTKRKPSSRRSATRGARKPARPVDFRWQRPASEVLTRVANLPSRAEMQRPQLKADLAENLLRTYDALWRRARATHSALVDTTWRQLARACGYPEDTRTDRGHRSIARYLDLLAEAGMVTWGGAKTPTGRWQCLHVELLEPPSLVSTEGRSSSVGQASFACEARRRHETPRDRAARRRSPWRRCGGRRDAVARHDLSWSKNVRSPYSETAGTSFRAVFSDERTPARGRDASDAVAAPGRAPTNSGDEEERDRRRLARRERRAVARAEAFAADRAVAVLAKRRDPAEAVAVAAAVLGCRPDEIVGRVRSIKARR